MTADSPLLTLTPRNTSANRKIPAESGVAAPQSCKRFAATVASAVAASSRSERRHICKNIRAEWLRWTLRSCTPSARERCSATSSRRFRPRQSHDPGQHDATLRTFDDAVARPGIRRGERVDVEQGWSTTLQRWNRAVRVPQYTTGPTRPLRGRDATSRVARTRERAFRLHGVPCATDTEVYMPPSGHSYTGRESVE
jgi:hypothetical protein